MIFIMLTKISFSERIIPLVGINFLQVADIYIVEPELSIHWSREWRWRMKMELEQGRQAMLQLHAIDQQFYHLLGCVVY